MRTYGIHGGERQLANLFRTEPRNGFEEHFAFVYRDTDCETYFRSIPTVTLHTLLPLPLQPRVSPWAELVAMALLLPVLQLRLMLLLRRIQGRICVAHGFQAALVAWPAAWLFRSVRFAYVHHGTKSAAGRHPSFRLLYRPFGVVAGVSQAAVASLAGLVGGERLTVAENGLDWRAVQARLRDCASERSENPVVVSVGRLMRGKGQDLLIEAFDLFRRRWPAAQLWLVGEGPDRKRLEEQCNRRGLSGHVRFWGERNDVPCLLRASHIFALASESEGLSLAVLEAMALGLPSVVTDAPGVTECHVAGVTGHVVDRRADAIAEKLEELAGDPQLRRRMGEAAQKRTRSRYSMEASRQRYLGLYRRLIESRCTES